MEQLKRENAELKEKLTKQSQTTIIRGAAKESKELAELRLQRKKEL
jgi:hypothetical protein